MTGNKGKFDEAKSVVSNIEMLDIDLVEIQEIDARKVIESKIQEGLRIKKTELIVEDTSLYLDALGGLPGPLIKWFMKTIGNEGLYDIAMKLGNTKAVAKTIVGYARDEKISFFEGVIEGNIVEPRGDNGFGWDSIFQPDGYSKTFAEMDSDEKNSLSMRKTAFENLKRYITE